MKITIESTTQIVFVENAEEGDRISFVPRVSAVPARVWEGHTDSGIPVTCCITRIAAPQTENLTQFETELRECREPQMPNVFPLRLIL